MIGRARRRPLRLLQGAARRARLVLCAWLVVLAPAAQAEILSAQYAEPTTRYAHGVLGDAVEWGALVLDTRSAGKATTVTISLPETRVFEDLEPRLFDLDLEDGDAEVVVIESDARLGAALAVYDETGKIAATPHIGRANRWLAPLGAADLDGDGKIEIAYIDRPHLAKTLRVWRYDGGKLTEVASKAGLTNHRIGEDFISGGIRECGQGPEIITADGAWARVMATRLDGRGLTSRDLGRFRGQASLRAALECKTP